MADCPYARPLINADNVCTACEAGKMFSANEDECVAPGEPGCVRKATFGGEQRCTADETCPPNTWVSMDDEFLCVTECERWVKDAATSELRCVDECPDWWYSSDGGLCVEEIWRKNTAIAVPIAVVALAAIAIITVIIVKKRGKAKAQAQEHEPTRLHVVKT